MEKKGITKKELKEKIIKTKPILTCEAIIKYKIPNLSKEKGEIDGGLFLGMKDWGFNDIFAELIYGWCPFF